MDFKFLETWQNADKSPTSHVDCVEYPKMYVRSWQKARFLNW